MDIAVAPDRVSLAWWIEPDPDDPGIEDVRLRECRVPVFAGRGRGSGASV